MLIYQIAQSHFTTLRAKRATFIFDFWRENSNIWKLAMRRRLRGLRRTLFEKSIFFQKIQFWQNSNIFTSFLPNFFWQFFSWNQSCQQLKSPKSQHFHEFFAPKNRQFSREIKVEFMDKKWRFWTVYGGKLASLAF